MVGVVGSLVTARTASPFSGPSPCVETVVTWFNPFDGQVGDRPLWAGELVVVVVVGLASILIDDLYGCLLRHACRRSRLEKGLLSRGLKSALQVLLPLLAIPSSSSLRRSVGE